MATVQPDGRVVRLTLRVAGVECGAGARAAHTPMPQRSPTEVLKRSWTDVLKRTVREFKEDHVVDWAAALTYYGVLAIFPAILALVSLLGLVGASAIQPLIDNLGTVAPGPAREIVTGAVENLHKSRATGGLLFIVGLAGALWSAWAMSAPSCGLQLHLRHRGGPPHLGQGPGSPRRDPGAGRALGAQRPGRGRHWWPGRAGRQSGRAG